LPGHEFADHVSRLFGNSLHAQICNYGEDMLVQSMLSFQELALFGEARLRKFFYEFIHYEELFDEQEDAETESSESAKA
jgi:hypothetical protein